MKDIRKVLVTGVFYAAAGSVPALIAVDKMTDGQLGRDVLEQLIYLKRAVNHETDLPPIEFVTPGTQELERGQCTMVDTPNGPVMMCVPG
ncbi:MAG: hypothetical protein AB7G06_09360 [Bdellovibrionales bacterium]